MNDGRQLLNDGDQRRLARQQPQLLTKVTKDGTSPNHRLALVQMHTKASGAPLTAVHRLSWPRRLCPGGNMKRLGGNGASCTCHAAFCLIDDKFAELRAAAIIRADSIGGRKSGSNRIVLWLRVVERFCKSRSPRAKKRSSRFGFP